MVFTIHRYIFRELFRVFALAAIALTLILSLGSMLRPIREYGVGPGQIIHLLGYFLPITLTFVLPMAALFAAALTYGRFAGDNELDACRASGISLLTLIYPGLCLAIIVAITTLILSFHVVPAFVHRAEKSIKANAKQILFRNIQRKGYYTLPGAEFRIYADHAMPDSDMLSGVIIIESEDSDITKLITAKAAKVVFEDIGKSFSRVKVVAQEAYQIDDYDHVYFKQLPASGRFESLLADNIKFQKIDQLKQIKADMTQFNPVRKLALSIRAQLASELLARAITDQITAGAIGYYQLIGEDRIVMFSAGRCAPKSPEYKDKDKPPTIELSGTVKLSEFDKVHQQLICRWESDKGTIRFESNEIGSPLEIVLDNPGWQRGDGLKGLAQRHVVKNLPLPEAIEEGLSEDNLLAKLKDLRSILANPTDGLTKLQQSLQRKIKSTTNEISSEIHSRLVFGLGCTVLILIGIALGIIFKGGHLLSAFGASSIPAAVLIVFIMAGKDLTKNHAVPMIVGTMVMWSSLLILAVVAVVIYHKLLKT